MKTNHHPFALLLQGPTKYLMLLWDVLFALFLVIGLEAIGIVHIGPGGAAGAIIGLLFVGVIWLSVSIELVKRWIASRSSLGEPDLK